MQIKHGRRVVSRRLVSLRPNCTYRARMSITSSHLRGRGQNAIIAGFQGNDLFKPASAPRRLIKRAV